MNKELELIIAFFIFMSAALFYYKAIIRMDWSYIGALIPRMYLFLAIMLSQFTPLGIEYIHLGILAVFIGDVITNTFIVLNHRFKIEIYASNLLNSLHDLDKKYQFLVNNSPIGIYVIDPNGRFEYVNETFCKLLEATETELLKTTIFDFIPLENKKQIALNITKRIEYPEELGDYITELLTKKGNRIKVRVMARKTINGHATITGAIIQTKEG